MAKKIIEKFIWLTLVGRDESDDNVMVNANEILFAMGVDEGTRVALAHGNWLLVEETVTEIYDAIVEHEGKDK
jgi:hypothetical protein